MCNQKTFELISLSTLIEHLGSEEEIREFLFSFRCAKNADIQDFLHDKAVRFEKSQITKTFFLIEKDSGVICAYFSLSFKTIEISSSVSRSQVKKLTGGFTEIRRINVFLVAQIGKNEALANNMVRLPMILSEIYEKISHAQSSVGGRMIILECEDNPKLIKLYQENDFKLLKTEDEADLKTMYLIPKFE